MARKPAPPVPITSGYCNPTLPRTPEYDPHALCGMSRCVCPCHQEEPAMLRSEIVPTGEHATPCDPGDAASPEDCVATVRAAADRLNAAMLGYGPDDWHDALTLLRDLRKATATLAKLDATLVQWLYLHGEHGKRLIDGMGEVWIGRGRSKEHWEGNAAAKDYVEARIRENDGEMPDPDQVVAWVLDVVPASKCRVTPLRAAGLDPEDYRESLPGSLSVTLPPTT